MLAVFPVFSRYLQIIIKQVSFQVLVPNDCWF